MKVKFYWAGPCCCDEPYSEEMEFPDDASNEVIEEAIYEWTVNNIETYWEKI